MWQSILDALAPAYQPVFDLMDGITPQEDLVLIYLLATLLIGLYKRSDTDINSYLFAGRRLTIPAFVATLVTTWYGGILEIGRVSFHNGIVTWIIFGVFYYIAALLFLKFIAPKIYDLKIRTIPEFLNHQYGKAVALFGFVFVFLMVSPAPYLKILGSLFRHLWDIPEITALEIGALFSIVYAIGGGFSSVVRTDKLQFVLMFSGFAFILIMAVNQYGGVQFLETHAPDYAFSVPGKLSWSFILIWGFIAMITFIDPGFYQRCYAGNNVMDVQKGLKISIMFWLLFDFMTVFTGIYASAILPADIAGSPYLELADILLPPITRGFFLVSLFAIVMSTIDSYTFISAYTLGKDLPEILAGPGLKVQTMKLTQIAILITAIFSILLARYFPHAIDIWYTMGTFSIPVLLVPMVAAMYKKPLHHPLPVMFLSLLVSLIWYGIGYYSQKNGELIYPFGVEPLYPGLLVSISLYCLFNLFPGRTKTENVTG